MNNLQYFVRNAKNISRLIESIMNENCETCPAKAFCYADGRRIEQKYETCSDAFIAWSLKEKKTRSKKNAEPQPCLETTNT